MTRKRGLSAAEADAADAADAVDAAVKVENPTIMEVGIIQKVERIIMTRRQTTPMKTAVKMIDGMIRMEEDRTCPRRRASPVSEADPPMMIAPIVIMVVIMVVVAMESIVMEAAIVVMIKEGDEASPTKAGNDEIREIEL